MLYIGAMRLGYTEEEVFRMTPRKFFKIYDEYLEMNGIEKNQAAGRRKACGIDDLP